LQVWSAAASPVIRAIYGLERSPAEAFVMASHDQISPALA
jgi:hypothetical protein